MQLRSKIFLAVFVVGFSLSALLYYLWIPSVNADSEEILISRTKISLGITAETIIPLLIENQYANIYESLDTLLRANPDWVEIELRGQDGNLIYPLSPITISENGEYIKFVQSLSIGEENFGKLILLADLRKPFAFFHRHNLEFLFFLIMGLALGLAVIMLLLELFVIRPTKHLAFATEQMAKGDYSISFSSNSKDEIGTLIRTFLVMRDTISKNENVLRTSKEETEIANHAKSEFLASMSHELRTPLNAVLGFAQMMQFDPKNPLTPTQKKQTDSILEGGNHLLELINNVLDLSKIEAEQISLSLEKVNANRVIADCVSLIHPLGDLHGIKIVNQFVGKRISSLFTDQLRFKQVVINLLSNAVKYNRDGGTVTIAGHETKDGYLHLSVKDTGIGIAKDDFSGVFQMFHRLDADPMIAREGTGVGLTVTKLLVEQMAGHIGFESELGVGSTFWVELPLYSNENVLIWSDSLRVGVTSIDEDHQTIISLANKTSYRDIDDADMGKIIGELINYTRHHFRREEAVMEACDFPDLRAHRKLHHTLEAQVQKLSDEWRKDHNPKMLNTLRVFLRNWLIGHIATKDSRIADYAMGKDPEIRKALEKLE